MTSKVVYTGDLRTLCTHLQSGNTIETDAPTDNHGKGDRFSPTDLLATALASCMITTMGIACLTHDINIDGMVCDVQKIMIPSPRKVGEVKVDMSFPNSKPFTDKEKKVLETAAQNCPIMESLSCIKTLNITWPTE